VAAHMRAGSESPRGRGNLRAERDFEANIVDSAVSESLVVIRVMECVVAIWSSARSALTVTAIEEAERDWDIEGMW